MILAIKMILGHIEGKITTNDFTFLAKEEPKNFEYVQVYHRVYDFILCQIIEVTKTADKTLAACQVIGYQDKGKIRCPRIPFDPGSEVLRAEDEFISSVISLDDADSNAYIGHLDGRTIPVAIDLNTVLTKHIAVLAKSGAGKSYTVGVLLEEILERGVPLIVIDPHGEYSSLAIPAEEDPELMASFGIEPKKYAVSEYADIELVPGAKPFRLSTHLSALELSHLLPGKLTANQQAILYSALKNLHDVTFDSLLGELELEESPAKYSIMSTIEYLRSLSVFSANSTPYSELVKPSHATVINLKGIAPDVQEIIVYKLCKDLFQLRKQNKVSPFFLVIEEAHNYCPERSFGEKKSSKILRDIASEGRKFGLGLCVVSQRPARVDKSVLSQCSTQIILKVTNPNDLKAISSSVEGITSESESEVKHLAIGTALVTGITDVPLFVRIRPRRTAHGGVAVDILGEQRPAQEPTNVFDQVQSFADQEMLPLIKPVITPQDLEVMSDEPLLGVHTVLIPAYQFQCREGEERYKLLVEMREGGIIVDKETAQAKHLPALHKLSKRELGILQAIFAKGSLAKDDLITQLGGALAIDDELAPLIAEGYLQEAAGSLSVTDKYVFTRLSKLANYDAVSYESLSYHEKKPSALDVDEVRQHLNKFTTVEDQFECFLVTYKPLVKSDGLNNNT